MKKIILLSALAFGIAFASCKKNRTCTCTFVDSGSGKAHTEVTTYNEVSAKNALASCNSGTSYNVDEPFDVQTRNCSLK